MDDYLLNTERTRAILSVPFGVACYEGGPRNGQFVGVHMGVVATWEEGLRWLRSEAVNMIQVWAATNKGEMN